MASIGTWPASIEPITCRMVMQTSQIVNAAQNGGSEQVVDLLADRWMCYLTLPQAYPADARAIEAFVARFRGQVNTVNLWHFASPTTQGTISGSPTVSGAHSLGASTLEIQAAAGETVKAGDMLGAGGLLLMVAEDATADGSGVLTVTLTNRLRTALADGAEVTLTKPTAAFRLLACSGVGYVGALSDEVTMTLGEAV